MAKKEKKKASKAEEPAAAYRKVEIYSSFEDMNTANIKEMAALTPQERIKNTVELILRVYGVTREELNRRGGKNKITIIRYE